jgi:APA family basic amino acid/polyamine antiporter
MRRTNQAAAAADATSASKAEGSLVRALGVWGLAASIVNITIGGGIFRAPGSPELAGRLGPTAPLAYVVCALAMTFVVLCFAEAGSRVARTGGPYAYVERAFGGLAGFAVGWMLWVVGTVATAAVGTIFADALQHMLPSLASGSGRVAILVVVFGIVTTINVLGVKFGARLNMLSTLAKLLPLALLVLVGIWRVQRENFVFASLPPANEITRASVFLIFAYAGIESALVPSGEVRDSSRTVPRAVLLALAVVTVLYILIHTVAQGVLGHTLNGRVSPLADTAEVVMGPLGGSLLSIAVVVSTLGYLCGMILAIPRALFAFGRDGVLPRALAAVHSRYRTPWIAIIVQSGLSLVFALSSAFEPLAILANITVLIVYLGCAAAAWQLRRTAARDITEATVKPLPGSWLAPPVAVAVIIVLLTSITKKEWLVAGSCVLAGFVLYSINRPVGWLTRRQ